jgi:NAD(P)-dependent dehydrogenase (short-subunit alcohol dehydrogenase family)
MCISYNSAKAALIRATACLQAELDVDGLDNIHVYALHPGANKTGLQGPLPQPEPLEINAN